MTNISFHWSGVKLIRLSSSHLIVRVDEPSRSISTFGFNIEIDFPSIERTDGRLTMFNIV